MGNKNQSKDGAVNEPLLISLYVPCSNFGWDSVLSGKSMGLVIKSSRQVGEVYESESPGGAGQEQIHLRKVNAGNGLPPWRGLARSGQEGRLARWAWAEAGFLFMAQLRSEALPADESGFIYWAI